MLLEKRRVGDDCYVNETFKCQVEHETGCRNGGDSRWRRTDVRKNHTAIAVTSSTEDGYPLLLETLDDLVQTLPSVFRTVIGEPLLDVKIRPLPVPVICMVISGSDG